MDKLKELKPKKFFKFFSEISKIPRGSENREGIKEYIVSFAKEHSLEYYEDEYDNVIIYKKGTCGFEESEPLILQGHTDIVCQKKEGLSFDFEKDEIRLLLDGDYLKAEGTTLGADDGFALALMLSFLSDETIEHPPIEAVFTSDEEIGMIGAKALDLTKLKGKRMINLDAEDLSSLTVSCAGGSDFIMKLPKKTRIKEGEKVTLNLKGLRGGHSGVEIDSGSVNADMLLGRILNHLNLNYSFDIVNVEGGTKANAIPSYATAELLIYGDDITSELTNYLSSVKEEIASREKDFAFEIQKDKRGKAKVLTEKTKNALITALTLSPNGIITMSKEIENLVETSLNLGILKMNEEEILFHYALRSSKKSALFALEEKMIAFAKLLDAKYEAFGHYPPWEFNDKSRLQKIYKEVYLEKTGGEIKVEAIHAGLECGVFASGIEGFDAISVGADIKDVHTVNEKMSVSSVEKIYGILLEVVKRLK